MVYKQGPHAVASYIQFRHFAILPHDIPYMVEPQVIAYFSVRSFSGKFFAQFFECASLKRDFRLFAFYFFGIKCEQVILPIIRKAVQILQTLVLYEISLLLLIKLNLYLFAELR